MLAGCLQIRSHSNSTARGREPPIYRRLPSRGRNRGNGGRSARRSPWTTTGHEAILPARPRRQSHAVRETSTETGQTRGDRTRQQLVLATTLLHFRPTVFEDRAAISNDDLSLTRGPRCANQHVEPATETAFELHSLRESIAWFPCLPTQEIASELWKASWIKIRRGKRGLKRASQDEQAVFPLERDTRKWNGTRWNWFFSFEELVTGWFIGDSGWRISGYGVGWMKEKVELTSFLLAGFWGD